MLFVLYTLSIGAFVLFKMNLNKDDLHSFRQLNLFEQS